MAVRLNAEVILYTYQHVREDAITLFGFTTMEEHDLFLQLISVKAVSYTHLQLKDRRNAT